MGIELEREVEVQDIEYPLVSVVIPTHNRKERLVRLIKSILENNYPEDKLEIVVVDDASTDRTHEEIAKLFPHVRVIRNERKRLVAASRNIGFKSSKGIFLFFIDDDNVVDKSCIRELVKVMLRSENIGVAAPIAYYLQEPEIIWCAGVKRNMITSKTTYLGNGQVDRGQYNTLVESDDFPNAFMVRRKIMENEGILFSEKIFSWVYEESDFCYSIKKKGWKIVLVPTAKVWHDIACNEIITHTTEVKAYFLGRNRILFHRKYGRQIEFLIFIAIFLSVFTLVYTLWYLWNGIKEGKLPQAFRISKFYVRGVIDGIRIIRINRLES